MTGTARRRDVPSSPRGHPRCHGARRQAQALRGKCAAVTSGRTAAPRTAQRPRLTRPEAMTRPRGQAVNQSQASGSQEGAFGEPPPQSHAYEGQGGYSWVLSGVTPPPCRHPGRERPPWRTPFPHRRVGTPTPQLGALVVLLSPVGCEMTNYHSPLAHPLAPERCWGAGPG